MQPSHNTSQNTSRKKIQFYSYGLLDRIGKGYSSIVYRGRNDNTNQVVAIKVIDMKGVRDSVGKEMLDCQIEALRTLKHPNILKCFDVFTTQNNCYIITQFCDEGDLASHLQKKKKLSEIQTLNLLRDIASGFIQIAEKEFLHRDLKLANIFMNKGVAKIADFGFAKKNKNPGQKEKYNVGSPLYMSPEALKRNIYSIKNDIWSIGVIIYEMLHGETPWECRTEKQLMDKMVRIPVKFGSLVKVSDELKEFIKKCLQVEQSRRYGIEQIKQNALIKKLLGDAKKDVIKNEEKPKIDQKRIQKQERVTAHITQDLALAKILNEAQKKKTEIDKSQRMRIQSNKQNISGIKPIIEKNNIIIVHNLNIFRLLYKILQKIKYLNAQEKQLIDLLTNEVLAKVNLMHQVITNQKFTLLPELKQPQKYFNELTNPSIKKYKTVVNQYYKKYTEQLKKTNSSLNSSLLLNRLRQFLRRKPLNNQNECLMYHWIVEYLLLKDQARKGVVENIIEGDIKPTIESVKTRLKLI